MKLDNHIALRFLTDKDFWLELIKFQFPEEIKLQEPTKSMLSLWDSLHIKSNHRPRYITKTVLEKLDFLKVNRKENVFDWTVFKNIPNEKFTYIFPENSVMRVVVIDDVIQIINCDFEFEKGSKLMGVANWTIIYMNRVTGDICSHIEDDERGSRLEAFAYKLMCFVHLSDIEEIEILSGRKWGTRKQGKIINTLPFDLLRIDSTWNISSIRTDGFGVKGHFAIRWSGKGRLIPKVVWIEPFQKKGYKRIAKKTTN